MRRLAAFGLAAGCSVAGLASTGCRTAAPVRSEPPPVAKAAPATPIRHASAQAPSDDKLARAEVSVPEREANIDLAYALEVAGAANPTIALARETVVEARARQKQAYALILPNLNAGANVRIHTGPVQRSPGTILDVSSQSLYFGSGARAVGTGTVAIPGIRAVYPLADVVLGRRLVQQRVAAVRGDSVAVQNLTLLDVATAYLELLGADAALEALRHSEAEFAEIARLTAQYAKAGQGRDADACRAEANLELLRRESQEVRGERAAASARLAGMLSLDPTQALIPPGGRLYPLGFFDPATDLDSLAAQALQARPEVNARAAEVAESGIRLRQEKLRPWLPTVGVGFSAGSFGGGSDLTASSYGGFGGRTDFDLFAVWTVQNLGLGNRALQNRGRAHVGQAVARLDSAQNRIRAEVAESLAQIRSARSRIETARSQLATAQQGFGEEMARIKQDEGRPLEVLDSTRQLGESRLELIRAITGHNVAQFRLLAAVGTPPDRVTPTSR